MQLMCNKNLQKNFKNSLKNTRMGNRRGLQILKSMI